MLLLRFFMILFTSLVAGNIAPDSYQKPLESERSQALSSPDSDRVYEALLRSKIIPEVIDDFELNYLFTAQWPGGDEHQANLGNDVEPGDWISKPPSITLSPVAHIVANLLCGPAAQVDPSLSMAKLTYVVALTDPDAPSRDDPERSEFCHWLAAGHPVVNPRVHVSDCYTLSVSGLEDLLSYRPPSPPAKTGPHRYVFVLLAHFPPTLDPLNLTRPERDWGSNGGVKQWARENSLVPIGSNFLYAHNPDQ
ncbi:lipid binding protein [Pyricularia oryzae 70-15]|uniref:Lipid binding protein n=3 Tax=Pyricularia oryzae TaxID=318829 RepID=G4MZH8_PYRO7|nr:lipid binding protein [Pyricularia oryzae 70-15]EHA54537.1 lipid binding protein [Pyricularia oryzae 70-15]ELQ37500.1 lipid binding protein [Pyricularia oryzae Y34]KAI7931686.1 lipid binding protein [Pyricularia oryzae]KAI7932827.1 lipid binding protein [Pyricularia oryzae]